MLLTCPNCATRYDVPEESLGASGRVVRCGNCGEQWTAVAPNVVMMPQPTAPEPETPAQTGAQTGDDTAGAAPEPAEPAPEQAEQPGAMANLAEEDADLFEQPQPEQEGWLGAVDDDARTALAFDEGHRFESDAGADGEIRFDDDAASAEAPTPAAEPEPVRRNVPAVPAGRRMAPVWLGLGWSSLALFWAVLLAGVFVFHERIAVAWPASRPLFETIGLGAPDKYLAEDVRDILRFNHSSQAERRPSQPGFFLSTTISSAGRQVHRLPPLEVVIFDAQGRELQRWPMEPEQTILEPGERIEAEAHVRREPDGAARWDVLVAR